MGPSKHTITTQGLFELYGLARLYMSSRIFKTSVTAWIKDETSMDLIENFRTDPGPPLERLSS